MPARPPALVLEVSAYFFRLASESLRLFSNERLAFGSLRELVEMRAADAVEGLAKHAAATLRGHLETIPSNGGVRLELALSEDARAALLRARTRLATHLGQETSPADALSVLLFDYVVEQQAARLLKKVNGGNLPPRDAESYSASWAENILRFR